MLFTDSDGETMPLGMVSSGVTAARIAERSTPERKMILRKRDRDWLVEVRRVETEASSARADVAKLQKQLYDTQEQLRQARREGHDYECSRTLDSSAACNCSVRRALEAHPEEMHVVFVDPQEMRLVPVEEGEEPTMHFTIGRSKYKLVRKE